MKFKLSIKIFLVTSLALITAASYLINKHARKSEAPSSSKNVTTKQESAEEYNNRKRKEAKQTDYGKKLTIDGYDPASEKIIEPINLWGNYQTRTYVGTVKHGEIVTLIKREGDGVLIEKNSGLRGWVTYFFIKEYNHEAEKRGDK